MCGNVQTNEGYKRPNNTRRNGNNSNNNCVRLNLTCSYRLWCFVCELIISLVISCAFQQKNGFDRFVWRFAVRSCEVLDRFFFRFQFDDLLRDLFTILLLWRCFLDFFFNCCCMDWIIDVSRFVKDIDARDLVREAIFYLAENEMRND